MGDRNPRFAAKPNFWEFKLGDQYNKLASPEDGEKNAVFIRWLETLRASNELSHVGRRIGVRKLVRRGLCDK